MRPNKARFVTACQQSLALGAVLAVLAPAANVITLDVVTGPARQQVAVAERPSLDRSDPVRVAPAPKAEVETAPVEAEVREVPMTADEPADRPRPRPDRGERVTASPEEVEGYGAVGVTWSPETPVEDDEIALRVRTRTGDEWSDWTELEYHDEHAPDPDSPEAKGSRPGTEVLLVGEVDEVQAEAVTQDGVAAPVDMKLAVIEPGDGSGTTVEEPAIDTATVDDGAEPLEEGPEPIGEGATGTAEEDAVSLMSGATDPDPTVTDPAPADDTIDLQATSVTPKPRIFSRAQWGADERLRSGSPSYYEIHAGFVHHTVNANNYSRDEVPGIIRSIYAYHTRTRGWSDVGYNFLVDRFGRIWEGRYGGVDRPVVGAHTSGYNDHAFAMSAIGNFDIVQPTSAMLDAYGRLFAWKLSLHGVTASSPSQRVGSRTFPAVNGHRDAGSTACPGRYLYAKLSTIRSLAQKYQAAWGGRERTRDVAGSEHPDILLRHAGRGTGFVLPTEGFLAFKRARTLDTGFGNYDTALPSPDLTGDGRPDMFVRAGSGTAGVRPGNADGTFGRTIGVTRAFRRLDQITAVGDLDGNGKADVVARNPNTGRLLLFSGRGNGSFDRTGLSGQWLDYDLTVAAGDVDRDGKRDLLARQGNTLWLHRGAGGARLQTPTKVNGRFWGQWDTITAGGDWSGDGLVDLLVRSKSDRKARIYTGRGNGKVNWQPLGPYGRVARTTHLAGLDVIGTEDPDIVGLRNDRLVVIAHAGTYNTSRKIRLGSAFKAADRILNVGDWDGDGHGDVISRAGGDLLLHLGTGDGLQAPVRIGRGWSGVELLEAVGDVTGDGRPDLMGQPGSKAMRIYPGRGASGLGPSYVARSSINATRQLGIGLWDGDGAPDNAFRVGDRLVWLRGNGPGGLTGSTGTLASVNLARFDWVISAGNVDGRGRSDLIAREPSTGKLYLLPGKRDGFAAPRYLAGGFKNYDLVG